MCGKKHTDFDKTELEVHFFTFRSDKDGNTILVFLEMFSGRFPLHLVLSIVNILYPWLPQCGLLKSQRINNYVLIDFTYRGCLKVDALNDC